MRMKSLIKTLLLPMILTGFVYSCSGANKACKQKQEIVYSYFSLASGKILRRHVSDGVIVLEQIKDSAVTHFLRSKGLYIKDNDEWILSTQYVDPCNNQGHEQLKAFPGNDYSVAFLIMISLHNFNDDDYDEDWVKRHAELIRNASLDEIPEVADRLIAISDTMGKDGSTLDDVGLAE